MSSDYHRKGESISGKNVTKADLIKYRVPNEPGVAIKRIRDIIDSERLTTS